MLFLHNLQSLSIVPTTPHPIVPWLPCAIYSNLFGPRATKLSTQSPKVMLQMCSNVTLVLLILRSLSFLIQPLPISMNLQVIDRATLAMPRHHPYYHLTSLSISSPSSICVPTILYTLKYTYQNKASSNLNPLSKHQNPRSHQTTQGT